MVYISGSRGRGGVMLVRCFGCYHMLLALLRMYSEEYHSRREKSRETRYRTPNKKPGNGSHPTPKVHRNSPSS